MGVSCLTNRWKCVRARRGGSFFLGVLNWAEQVFFLTRKCLILTTPLYLPLAEKTAQVQYRKTLGHHSVQKARCLLQCRGKEIAQHYLRSYGKLKGSSLEVGGLWNASEQTLASFNGFPGSWPCGDINVRFQGRAREDSCLFLVIDQFGFRSITVGFD